MNYVFFDLETQKLFQDVGGRDASKLRLACGVTYSRIKMISKFIGNAMRKRWLRN